MDYYGALYTSIMLMRTNPPFHQNRVISLAEVVIQLIVNQEDKRTAGNGARDSNATSSV